MLCSLLIRFEDLIPVPEDRDSQIVGERIHSPSYGSSVIVLNLLGRYLDSGVETFDVLL